MNRDIHDLIAQAIAHSLQYPVGKSLEECVATIDRELTAAGVVLLEREEIEQLIPYIDAAADEKGDGRALAIAMRLRAYLHEPDLSEQ